MVRLALHSIAYEAKTLNLAKEGSTAFYVDGTDGNDLHDGGSWGQAFKTIQHAIDESGSWGKIFVKSGTYHEDLMITGKIGIHLIGEYRTNTIISGTISAIIIYGARCTIEEISFKGAAEHVIKLVGTYNTVLNCYAEKTAATNGANVSITGDHSTVDNLTISACAAASAAYGILTTSEYCEFKNCHMTAANLTNGIYTSGSDCCKVHDNTIENAAVGINIGASSDYNTIFHNNLIGNTAQINDAGTSNKWFENHYNNHVVDTNNDGMADTSYTEGGATDYQPMSRRNGWHQMSLSSSGGDATAANQAAIITHLTDIKGATFVGATDSIEAIRNRGDAAWITGGSSGLSSLASGTAQGGAGNSITLASGESATNNLFNGTRVLITGGTGAGQARIITGYTGATKVAAIYPIWVTQPDATSGYEVQAAEANIGAVNNDAQSMIDLKDFVDFGYDPATNKVQGVVLADTVTTLTGHTAQTGDSFARLGNPAGASIAADLLAIDNLVDDLETRLSAVRAGYIDNLSAGGVALASVCTAARLAHLTQDVTVGIKKNVAYNMVFKMVDATDFATPEPSITVVEEISKDGGSFTACTNTFAEIANGWYKIALTATEMNANEIIFKGTGSGCAQCDRLIITEA